SKHEGLHDTEAVRDASRQGAALRGACEAGRERRRLLAALRRKRGDGLGVEIGRLPRGVAREEVVAGDRARRASLLLLQRGWDGQLAARRLEVLVGEELPPHRELREEDREDKQDPQHPAPPELEPLPSRQVRDVPDHDRSFPVVGSVPVISMKNSSSDRWTGTSSLT